MQGLRLRLPKNAANSAQNERSLRCEFLTQDTRNGRKRTRARNELRIIDGFRGGEGAPRIWNAAHAGLHCADKPNELNRRTFACPALEPGRRRLQPIVLVATEIEPAGTQICGPGERTQAARRGFPPLLAQPARPASISVRFGRRGFHLPYAPSLYSYSGKTDGLVEVLRPIVAATPETRSNRRERMA
jgi:hypothetical protein